MLILYGCTTLARPVRYSFFFNDTATTEIYTLSLHDALPIYRVARPALDGTVPGGGKVDRPGGNGTAGDGQDARDRAGPRRGGPGLEPGVPAGGVRGAGQPGAGPHRARGGLRPRRGAATP